MKKLKAATGSILNTQYNKAVYSGVVGAAVDFLYGLLAEFGVDVSPSLQTKTLILAMAITTLIVRNKEQSRGESNMSNTGKKVLPFVFLAATALVAGCAKNVSTVDIASDVADTMRGLTVGSLRLLHKHAPEQVAPAKEDFMAVVSEGEKYRDGSAEIKDFSDTLWSTFDRVNSRVQVIEDSDYLDLVMILYGTATSWADTFLVDQSIPENVLAYVNAVIDGIESGLAEFEAWELAQGEGEGA